MFRVGQAVTQRVVSFVLLTLRRMSVTSGYIYV